MTGYGLVFSIRGAAVLSVSINEPIFYRLRFIILIQPEANRTPYLDIIKRQLKIKQAEDRQQLQQVNSMAAKKPQKVEKRIKDPVSQMKIHRESLKKQKMCEKVYEDFKINEPHKVNFHAEKPNNNPFLLMKYKNEGRTINGVNIEQKLDDDLQKSNLTAEITQKLQGVTDVPKDKWQVPQTSNQQFGWYVDKANDKDSKFIYKRQGCNETHYADSYYTMKHTSLFSRPKKDK